MTRAVRDALNDLAGQAAAEAGIARELIFEAVIVGNPIMHHLVLGIDPTELGQAPFALATADALNLWAEEIELRLHQDARIYILPCIAGHVGADAAAVALSEAPQPVRRARCSSSTSAPTPRSCSATASGVLACSSPTGPAFEGAQISSGQRAAPGAIERVEIDPVTQGAPLPRHRQRRLVRRPRPSRRTPASPASAAPASSRRSPRCALAGLVDASGLDRLRRADRHRPHGRRKAAPTPTACTATSSSPRATSAPSSSPSPPSTPAPAC